MTSQQGETPHMSWIFINTTVRMSQPPTVDPKHQLDYQSMLHKIPKEHRSHLHYVLSLKSRNCGSVMFSAISRVFSLLFCFCLCCSFQIYENYPTTGKGQEEIGWNPSLDETVCDKHSQLRTEGWTLNVGLVNILTATVGPCSMPL
jgi:hypothetical protein